MPVIFGFNCEPSLVVIEQAMIGRVTPHALPNACFDRKNTYGTFLSSHNNGKCKMISMGSASAA
jgi:hypothetical protein